MSYESVRNSCLALPVDMLYGDGETFDSRCKLSIDVKFSGRFGVVSQGRNKGQ
jgi:hypothetical protein